MQYQNSFNTPPIAAQVDHEGSSHGSLGWSTSQPSYVVSGSSDYTQISGLRNVLLQLKQDLFHQGQPIIVGDRADDLARRFQLLEQHVEGLLRRKITFSLKDQHGGTRSLDYTSILNEKENQIVELERKILNL
jgi:hypothetical protein